MKKEEIIKIVKDAIDEIDATEIIEIRDDGQFIHFALNDNMVTSSLINYLVNEKISFYISAFNDDHFYVRPRIQINVRSF